MVDQCVIRLLCRRPNFVSDHRPAVEICLFIYHNLDLSLTLARRFSSITLTIA